MLADAKKKKIMDALGYRNITSGEVLQDELERIEDRTAIIKERLEMSEVLKPRAKSPPRFPQKPHQILPQRKTSLADLPRGKIDDALEPRQMVSEFPQAIARQLTAPGKKIFTSSFKTFSKSSGGKRDGQLVYAAVDRGIAKKLDDLNSADRKGADGLDKALDNRTFGTSHESEILNGSDDSLLVRLVAKETSADSPESEIEDEWDEDEDEGEEQDEGAENRPEFDEDNLWVQRFEEKYAAASWTDDHNMKIHDLVRNVTEGSLAGIRNAKDISKSIFNYQTIGAHHPAPTMNASASSGAPATSFCSEAANAHTSTSSDLQSLASSISRYRSVTPITVTDSNVGASLTKTSTAQSTTSNTPAIEGAAILRKMIKTPMEKDKQERYEAVELEDGNDEVYDGSHGGPKTIKEIMGISWDRLKEDDFITYKVIRFYQNNIVSQIVSNSLAKEARLREKTGTQVVFSTDKDRLPKHPNHTRVWHSRNLFCYKHGMECPICKVPCCALVACAMTFARGRHNTVDEKDYIAATALRIRKYIANPRDISTFMSCTECNKAVCPSCIGVCPNKVCQDRVCKSCKLNPWAECDWH